MTRPILWLLRFYQRGVSPFLGAHCRFSPSCSAYLQKAIVHQGVPRGIWLGLTRLLRCHPFSPGGYDPPPCDR